MSTTDNGGLRASGKHTGILTKSLTGKKIKSEFSTVSSRVVVTVVRPIKGYKIKVKLV